MTTREVILNMPEGLYSQLEAAATQMQRDTNSVILDALSAYVPPLTPDLNAELAAWDTLSDEALWDFESDLKTSS